MKKFTTVTIALLLGFVGGYGAQSLINKVADSKPFVAASKNQSLVTANPAPVQAPQLFQEAFKPASQAEPIATTKAHHTSQARKVYQALDMESKQEIEMVHLKDRLTIPERFKNGPPPEDIAMHRELREMDQTRHLQIDSASPQQSNTNYPRPIEDQDPPLLE